MAKCHYCHRAAREGQLTCGQPSCDEPSARVELHTTRKQGSIRRQGSQQSPSLDEDDDASVCGAVNAHMNLSCRLQRRHLGDLHASGNLVWRGGERPREADSTSLARLGPRAKPRDSERLRMLTEVLLTTRAQMLGLGEGLKGALARMPRAIDQQAVQGLVSALTAIVGRLSTYVVEERDTDIGSGSRLGADRITAGHFAPGARYPSPKPTVNTESRRLDPGRMALPAGSVDPPSYVVSSQRTVGEVLIYWRGSVSDLATDLRPHLTLDEREALALELLQLER